jgi:DNA-binding Xre family transcriptional regulator
VYVLYQIVQVNGINIGRFKIMQFLNNPDAYSLQKSLMIPKGQLESINGGRTDNTIAKRKTGLKDKKQSTKHTHNTIERIITTNVYSVYLNDLI